ncbi:MAG: FAD-dependent oxidoreductase [Verrucomicrobiia bacterium]|jgi:protoporphyrinogen oxidase
MKIQSSAPPKNQSSQAAKRVVIAGAGLAGLSAAWKLSEAGVSVQVVELEDAVGGLAATIGKDGYLFDFGGHRFITKRQEILDEIQQLMGDEFRPGVRKTQYLLWGKRLNYPLELGNLLRSINPLISAKCLLDYFWTSLKGKFTTLPEDSFESWVTKRFGRHLYEIFFGQYTTKIWGIPPSQLSRDWAAQRISIINLWDALRQLVWKPKHDPRTYTTKYYYCEYGIGSIANRMAEKIQGNGGIITLSTSLRQVNMADGRVVSAVVDSGGQTVELPCDYFLSTIPLTDLVRILKPSAPEKIVASANALRHRGVVFVFLTLDQEKVTDNDALYVPEPQYPFFRIEQFKFWSMKMVPSPDKTSLCLEISCFKNDEVWNAPDEWLYARCLDGLKASGLLPNNDTVRGYFVRRKAHVYPVFEIGYQEHAVALREYVDSIPNLISYGRQGYYQYIHMHHVIAKGFQAAHHILHGSDRKEVQRVGTEEEYFG